MAKPTVAGLNQMVDELLTIKAVADRYEKLKSQIKADMLALQKKEVAVAGKGRVFITPSEKVEYPIALANDVLGTELAEKVIQVRRWISNELVEAFIKAGEISEKQAAKLDAGAEKTPVASLYIRPLK